MILAFFSTSIIACQQEQNSLPKKEDNHPLIKKPITSCPNILIILTDDQGYHDVSYYGTEDIQTPNIDALVADGIRFDNFYANSSVCSPTRAALLSGRYPDRVGVPGVIRSIPSNSWGYLDPNAILLPQILKEADYKTALIGKWHLGLESPNLPNERGFDYFKGFLGDMMEDYWTHQRHGKNYMRENEKVIQPKGHATDLFTQWSIDYIQEQAKNTSPFFLCLNYAAPHYPIQPPKKWFKKVKKREKEISKKRAKLVAFIEHMDDGIGSVINALKAHGIYENTLILFTSDNGGRLADGADNGPLRDGKQSMYEGGLKVPACAVWRGQIQPGSTTPYLAMSMDVFPTLLDIIDLPSTQQIDGISFFPTLQGEKQSNDRPLFFSRREGNMIYRGLTIQAVQKDDWKLLQNNPFQAQELYHLKNDPKEQNNLAFKHKKKLQELNKLLMQHMQEAGRVPWQPPID